eukprot:6180796-Pleurochrysis_carterae.AAC.1
MVARCGAWRLVCESAKEGAKLGAKVKGRDRMVWREMRGADGKTIGRAPKSWRRGRVAIANGKHE